MLFPVTHDGGNVHILPNRTDPTDAKRFTYDYRNRLIEVRDQNQSTIVLLSTTTTASTTDSRKFLAVAPTCCISTIAGSAYSEERPAAGVGNEAGTRQPLCLPRPAMQFTTKFTK